jgi:serine protease
MWDFGDGSTGAGKNPTHMYTAGGTYTVTLVVNDGKVDSLPSTKSATIEEVNDPPVADAGPDQTSLVGESVTFDGSGSYDIDDGIAAYAWSFGDQTTASGITATHSYLTAGTYTVTLTVTDDGGLTADNTATVTVTEEPTLVMHVESIEMTLNTRTAGKNTFTKAIAIVTIVDVNDSPVEGATVYGSWSGATSDSDSGVTDTNGEVTLESDSVKNPVSGTTFTFIVDDVVKSTGTYESTNNTETSDSIIVQ